MSAAVVVCMWGELRVCRRNTYKPCVKREDSATYGYNLFIIFLLQFMIDKCNSY